MKDIKYKRLITLLESSKDPLVIACLNHIQQAIPGYMFAGAIPAKEVSEIYSKRKAWNESSVNPKRNSIQGYEQLVISLPKGADQKVEIHTLEWPDTTVMIFSDDQVTCLFGLLVIPKD